jgi:hypothetical protein
MTFVDLASLGSFVSGIAVMISLVYLGVQVKQAEKNQRALMQQGRADRISQNCFNVAGAGLSAIWNRGLNGDETLTAPEIDQFMMLFRGAMISAEDSFLQHEAGLLDPMAFNSFVAGVRHSVTLPGLRAAWQISSNQFGAEFVRFMNGLMRETAMPAKADRAAQWASTVRAINASQAV